MHKLVLVSYVFLQPEIWYLFRFFVCLFLSSWWVVLFCLFGLGFFVALCCLDFLFVLVLRTFISFILYPSSFLCNVSWEIMVSLTVYVHFFGGFGCLFVLWIWNDWDQRFSENRLYDHLLLHSFLPQAYIVPLQLKIFAGWGRSCFTKFKFQL